MSGLADAVDRERIRTSLDETFAVEAAAGTGKTTVLVDRIVNVLASGRTTVDKLVAVTFTEKAAGELKLRLRAELEARRQQAADAGRPDGAAALAAALANLEQAHVSTIHTFCADLLRERPVEACVDPRFAMLTDPQAQALFGGVFRDWLQARLEAPPPGVRRALRRRSYDDDGPIGRLERAAWTLADWRDFTAPWASGGFDQVGRVDALIAEVIEFAAMTAACTDGQDALYQDTEPARRLAGEVRLSEQVRPRDYDGLEAQLVSLDWWKFMEPRIGGRRTAPFGKGVTRQQVLDRHQALAARIKAFHCDADADLAARLHEELSTVIAAYEDAKARVGALDFLDLLVRARDVVRDRRDVRAAFQQRFTHLFVDEFQDTDPLQAEILLLLAADDPDATDWRAVRPAPGKLFVVGDPKQSIYRFRRADVGIYEAVREQLRRHGAACVALRSSFRAVPEIQHAVNAAFAPRMTGDPVAVQAHYVPLAAVRPAQTGQPAVVALPVPKARIWRGRPTKPSLAEGQPDAVAAFIHWLVRDSGWTVTDRERPAERTAIQARDVCLLFRRFDTRTKDGVVDVTRPYVQALEARDLPHLLVGGKSFHEREEVETLRTALAAIEWPDDELSVFGTLRGALFAFGDDVLLDYRARARHFRPFHPLQLAPEDPEPLREVAAALTLLRDLHVRRNQRPVAATIASLLEASRAHAIFALRPSGDQALANVQYVGELARQYEAAGGLSFRGFVERLRDEAAETRAAEAPILEEGSDGVRLMTVHKAKGLEFPVVVLVDIGADLSRSTASRWVDTDGRRCAVTLAGWAPAELRQHEALEVARDQAEGVRVAYVAATRARDLLVVCATGDLPCPGWIEPLNAALYPPEDRRREANRERWAFGFGHDTTLDRADTIPFTSVQPGIHGFEGDESYAVTWWDPARLDLDRQPSFGLRREELIAKDAGPGVVDAGLDAFHGWKVAREAAVEHGSRPSHRVVTVRARAESATFSRRPGEPSEGTSGAASGDVRVEAIPRPAGTAAGGLRFGALVHAVLALVPLDAGPATVDAVAAQQAIVLGADAAETQAAARVVGAALGHAAFTPLRDAEGRGALRREVPVALADADGAIVEGVVDAAFETDAGWVVVDFKTDADPGGALEAYLGQVRLYARAIATATNRPASGILLRL